MKRILGAAVLLVAVVALLYVRLPSATSLETANVRGNRAAPIEIEEWGDFG